MTDTLVGVIPPPEPAGAGDAEDREVSPGELAAVHDLVRRARKAGIALTGSEGLLKAMTKTVVEAALEQERSPTTSATTSTLLRAGIGPTPATGNGRRPS